MARHHLRAPLLACWAASALAACGGTPSAPTPVVPPSLTSASPSSGSAAGGTTVTLVGRNLTPGLTVRFGSATAAVLSVSGGSVAVVVTPAGIAGPVDVTVTNPDGGTARAVAAFAYEAPPPAPAPTLTRVSPASGGLAGGTTVTLSGADFAPGAAVRFDGLLADVTAVLPGAITALTPAHAAGAVSVEVSNPDGRKATLASGFTYEAAPPPPGPTPALTSVSPNSGSTLGGTALTLAGSNLDPAATVLVGGVAAAVTGSAPGSLSATTPAHGAGPADVTVVNPDGQSATLAGAFTFQVPPPPAPTVTRVDPGAGSTAGGTTVAVAGTGFAAGATVTFGGSAGNVTSLSATSIAVTTPAHAAGAVDVTVTNPDGGTATLAGAFTFQAPAGTPPTLTALSPTSGPAAGGNGCTLTGTGFVAGAQVTFGGALASQTALSATSIQVVVPPHAVGAADVTVINPGGLVATLTGAYNFLGPAPIVLALNVRGGPTSGGSQVLAVGSGFVPGVAVTVGGVPATGVGIVNGSGTGSTVRFFTPPHAEGYYDVVVTNPDGQSATVTRGFHYGPAPVITAVACGGAGGCSGARRDDSITLTGANFSVGSGESVRVLFTSPDTAQQALVTPVSATSTELVLVAPKLDPFTYVLTVTNQDGQFGVSPSTVTYR